MGRSSANTGGHYGREAITQIKYTLGEGGGAGIWRRNTNYKKAGGPHVIMSADADTEEERWLTCGGYQELQHRRGLRLHLLSFSSKVLRPSSSASARRRCSGNVTDWSSRWTVKIKRMTNERAAYTARGANPLLQPPSPRGPLLRSCHWGAPADSDGPWLDAPTVQQVGAGADGPTQNCLKPPQIRGCARGLHLYRPLPQNPSEVPFFFFNPAVFFPPFFD